jgi:hypothetical protein
MPGDQLTDRQLELIAKLASLEPTLTFMGGYAEDALLAGRVARLSAHLQNLDSVAVKVVVGLQLSTCQSVRMSG